MRREALPQLISEAHACTFDTGLVNFIWNWPRMPDHTLLKNPQGPRTRV